MQPSSPLPSSDSLVWHTPDLQLTSHAFSYAQSQYDGLLHTHREYCIVTCISGRMSIHLASAGQEELSAGDTVVVNPGLPHRCTFGLDELPSQGLTLLVTPHLLLALSLEMGILPALRGMPFFHRKLHEPELLASARKVAEERATMQKGFGLLVELLAKQMLVHVLRAWPHSAISEHTLHFPPQLPWLYMHRATEYMNQFGKSNFRLSELCQDIGLSSSRFTPLFKNSARMSPHSYYNRLLVFKAQRLLHLEGCSTKEAAYALGFRNVSHFCSLYHKLTGSVPQERLPPNNPQ